MTEPRTHRRRSRRRAALLTTAVLAAGAAAAAGLASVTGATGVSLSAKSAKTTKSVGSAGGLRAAFRTVSSWDEGYTGQYTLTNTGGGTVHGWTLSFDLPSGARLNSLWNGVSTVSGAHVQVKDDGWNADVAPGVSQTVGFVVSRRPGSSGAPAACQINGAPCAGGATPTLSPVPTPTPPPPAPTPTSTPTSAPPPPPTTASGGFSPYVDVGLYPPFDLPGVAAGTGVKTFNLAFIVSGGGCVPKWGGTQALGDNEVAKKIDALRAAGGDVRVSFGGANGTELGQACAGATQLASAYRQVVDAFKVKMVDFDIEGAAIADTTANDRRAQAIATLQKQVPGLEVSFTLPVLPSGLTQDGVALVTNAKRNGVAVAAVNVMAMDYGDGQAPNPSGKMGDYAIQAATSTEAQVRTALGVSSAWDKIAVTPMIGVNDTNTEIFTVADARKLAAFAKQKKLAWLSMWSMARDKQCPGGAQGWASATCSSIVQGDLDFTKAFTG